MEKIEKLTPEQSAYLPIFREEWLRVGLSTARVDREASTAAVKSLYAAAGQKEPVVMHFDSPAQCIMAVNFLRRFGKIGERANLGANLGDNLWANLRANLGANLGDNLWANLRANLGANLRANLRDNLWANLGDNLWANLRANLGANLGDNLGDNLGANLGANLWANLGANLRANLWANLGASVDTYFWGGQDAYWLAFYEFGQKIGVRYEKQAHFDAYMAYARSSGWLYAYPGIAIVSDRPVLLRKDEAARLHSDSGPALAFTDGYRLFCWHGMNIPPSHDWVITDKASVTPDAVDAEPNAELRRVMLEIMGFERYVDARGGKVVSEDTSHGRPRRLIEAKVGGETIRILDVYNGSLEDDGSRRRFHLGAMRGSETPHQAVAMSYGRNPKTFGEAVRT